MRKYFSHYRGFNQAVWLNTFGIFVNSFGFLPGAFLVLYLVHDRHFSVELSAIFMSIGSIGAILGAYLGGMLADRYSAVRLAQLSLFLFAVFIGLFPLIHHWLFAMTMLFWVYFLFGAFRPLNTIILMAHSTVLDRPRVMGVSRMSLNLGMSFSMIIGGALAEHNFSWYFYFCALMSLSATLLFVRFSQAMTIPANWHPPHDSNSKKFSTWQIFTDKPFMLLAIVFLGYCLVYYQVRMTFGLYMTSVYHLPLSTFGALFALNMVMVVVLEVPMMNLLKGRNQIKVCMVGIVFIAIGLGIIPFGAGLTAAILSTILWTIGEILTSSPFYAVVMDYANPKAKGAYLGFFQSLMSTGSIGSQLVGGFLYPFHTGKVLWFGCFFTSLLLLAGLAKLQRHPLQSEP